MTEHERLMFESGKKYSEYYEKNVITDISQLPEVVKNEVDRLFPNPDRPLNDCKIRLDKDKLKQFGTL